MTPDCAARPTWKDLVMVPKFATRPPAIEAAIAMAVAVPWASRPRNLAQAAAAAIGPSTADGCQPLRCSGVGSRVNDSAHTS